MQDALEGFHLSPRQLRLWSTAAAGAEIPRVVARVEVRAALDPRALAAAVRELVARHEILRTAFRCLPGMSLPLQVIAEHSPPRIEHRDLANLEPASAAAAVDAAFAELHQTELDLESDTPGRWLCLRLAPEHHQLLWVLPALCCDGASLENLIGELDELYRAVLEGRQTALDEATQFADIASWQAEMLAAEEAAEGRAFWRRWCDELPSTGELPFERQSESVETAEPPTATAALPAALVSAVLVAAEQRGVPPQVLLVSVWAAFLGRLLEAPAVALGLQIAGRPYDEMAAAIGPYARYVPLRCAVAGTVEFDRLLADTGAQLEELEGWLDSYDEHTLASSAGADAWPRFGFELVGAESTAGSFRLLAHDASTEPFELLLKVCLGPAGGSAEGRVEISWDAGRWAGWEFEQLPGWYCGLLADAVAGGGALERLRWADSGERRDRLAALATPAVDYATDAILPRLVAEQAELDGSRTALWSDGGELTYGELIERAEGLARQLCQRGVGPGDRVRKEQHISPEMVIGRLAIWRLGAAYVPLDPSYPAERLRFMIEDSELALLLCHADGLAEYAELAIGLLEVDGDGRSVVEPSEAGLSEGSTTLDELPAGACPELPAYVIYTSGSTGKPKGVVMSHRGIANRLLWMRRTQPLEAGDRVLQKTPYSFDASIWEIFLPLISGAGLVLAEPGGQRDNAYLLAAVASQRITVLQLVPSQLAVFLQQPGAAEGCRGLRRMYCGGEAFPAELAERFHQLCNAELYNLYGPTEAAIDAAYQPSRADRLAAAVPGSLLPIGRALDNVRLLVADRWLRPQPWGVPGELLIGGTGLALGYRRRPGLTAARFCPDPAAAEVGGRCYRSGDRVRRLRDGRLEFLGRLDEQVKLRGFRIELGEISSQIERQPGVREAVVVVHGKGTDQLLAAYLVPGEETPVAAELQRALVRWLPEHMVPAVFVELDVLPRLPNGKLDRGALPEPQLQRDPEAALVAPRNPTEELLAGFWTELLGVDAVGVDDDFFALGGHSLLATQLVARVRDLFAVEIKVAELFEQPTVAALASLVGDRRRFANGDAPPALEKAARLDEAPLSYAQRRLWFLDRLQPGLTAYNLPVALELEGVLDRSALAASLDSLVARHEILRTVFVERDGEPRQWLGEVRPVALPCVDLTALGTADATAEVRRQVDREAAHPFDLVSGPPLRALLLQLSAERHVAQLTLHHIVSDGWSNTVLIDELSALYTAFQGRLPNPLEPLPLQYADYAIWQRGWLHGEALAGLLEPWRRALDGVPRVLELPTDQPRPAVQTFAGATLDLALDTELSAGLRELARRHSATPFMVLLAAFQLLLGRYAGQRRLAVGSPVAGRGQLALEGLVGVFVNTLVLDAELAPRQSFADLLAAVRTTCLAAQTHQDLPFECLVEALETERNLSHSPLVQVLFALQNVPQAELHLPGLTLSALEAESHSAKTDLTLVVQDFEGAFAGSLEYNVDLFDATTARRLAAGWQALLTAIVGGPERTLAELSSLPVAEREQLLHEWQPAPRPADGEFVQVRRFEDWARRRPQGLAVADATGEVSYGELDAWAEALANRLLEHGAGPERIVAVCLPRSAALAAAILAVTKTGAAYLPLDPEHPADRRTLMLTDSRPCAVLVAEGASGPGVDDPRADDTATYEARPHLAVGSRPAAVDQPGRPLPRRRLAAAGLAYVIYTSGSTGRPKGTLLSHRGLANLTAWHRRVYAVRPEDRATLVASPAFDASVWELWPILTAGASLHVPPPAVRTVPAELYRWLAEQRIELAFLPTPLAEMMLEGATPDGLRLRALLVGGDRLRGGRRQALPFRLVNHYGPTEDTVVATYGEVAPDAEIDPPIGRPIDNHRLYVVDDELRPVPLGARGELVIGGSGLARGYLDRPATTAAALVPDPFADDGVGGGRLYCSGDLVRYRPNGEIDFLGRLDHQVKVRGFRIEPGEVEAALRELEGVLEVVVQALPAPAGGARLVAYVVPEETVDDPVAAAGQLREALRGRLPEHMVPSAFVALDALPISPNGKIDRAALPAPETVETAPYEAPRSTTEGQLAAIWAEVLGVDRVSRHDNFFALGGHSLVAMKVVSRVEERLAVELPVRELFASDSLAELAEALDRRTLATADEADLADLLDLLEDSVSETTAESVPVPQMVPGSEVEQ